jgi:acetolactate synthase I/II/III large subunit
MNGAEALVRSLIGAGVDVCFTNPGTSEMHVVAALDRISEMRCVLGLFEGVVTGAADGYARMAGRPACTLLHLGPGLANGIANLHNAYRAQVPIISIVGQHPLSHLHHDAPLTSDIEALARPYSKWLRTSRAASEVGKDAVEAQAAARTAPNGIATLIVPADAAWGDAGDAAAKTITPPKAPMPSASGIERAATMLRSGAPTILLLAGAGLYGEGLKCAGRIAGATKAKLLAPYPITRLERGAGLPLVDRMPYILEQAAALLAGYPQIILVGARVPVAYFAYPDKNSVPVAPGCEVHTLSSEGEDTVGALEALATLLSAGKSQMLAEQLDIPAVPSGGEVTTVNAAQAIGALLPANAIVVDESMTSGRSLMPATKGCAPHDWLTNTGGSIGIAMPLAVGAAVACPDRRVLCLSADGSGMYTLQGLWTMARERLNVTTIIFSNREYAVLKREFSGLGVGNPGERARNLFEIGRPDLDWTSLAQGMGVPATRATSIDVFVDALRRGLQTEGPTLIEIPL